MTKPTAVEKIKQMVPELGKQTALVRNAQSDLMRRIRALESERAELLKQPFTREDFAELTCIDIDRLANRYRTQLASRLNNQLMGKNHGGNLFPFVEEAIRRQGSHDSDSTYGGICDLGNIADNYYAELRQGALMFLCRDQVKAAAHEAAAAVDPWPFPDAKPMAASIARIGAIDAELETLHQQKGELDEIIAGIGVEPTPEPPMDAIPPEPKGREYQKRREDGSDPFWREGHEHFGGGLVDPRAALKDIRR